MAQNTNPNLFDRLMARIELAYAQNAGLSGKERARGYFRALSDLKSMLREPDNPQDEYLDPRAILRDSVEIIEAVRDEREAINGEKDEVLRDLVKRIKLVMGKPPRAGEANG